MFISWLLRFSGMRSLRAPLALHRHFPLIWPRSLVSDLLTPAKDGLLVPFPFVRFPYKPTIISQ